MVRRTTSGDSSDIWEWGDVGCRDSNGVSDGEELVGWQGYAEVGEA